MAVKILCDICGDDIDHDWHTYKIKMFDFDWTKGPFPEKTKLEICARCKEKLRHVVKTLNASEDRKETLNKMVNNNDKTS